MSPRKKRAIRKVRARERPLELANDMASNTRVEKKVPVLPAIPVEEEIPVPPSAPIEEEVFVHRSLSL